MKKSLFWLDLAIVALMGSIIAGAIDAFWRQDGSWLVVITLVLAAIIGALAAERLWRETSA